MFTSICLSLPKDNRTYVRSQVEIYELFLACLENKNKGIKLPKCITKSKQNLTRF